MKQELWTQNVQSARHIVPLSVDYLLNESDILFLNNALLTHGMHTITVDSVITGRMVMQTLLHSLPMLQDVACLTLASEPLNTGIIDIYDELLQKGSLAHGLHNGIEEFLLEHGYYDVMWIEITPELEKENWHMQFQESLFSCNLDRHMPIIQIRYLK